MIKFDQVSKSFNDHQKIAIQDVTFAVDDGEFVFITGHSGSGKTTLMRLLLKEYTPDTGDIFFNDLDLNQLSGRKVAELRRQMGIVFQDYQLLDDLTVWENIALPLTLAKQTREEINQRIAELLDLLQLTGYEKFFPSQLSGGEAQRISLARALAMAPKVIFADEPTGNLDQENTLSIIELLKTVNGYGTTVIVATHDLGLLDKVTQAHCLELDHGKLIKDNKKKTVEQKPTTAAPTAQSTTDKENKAKIVAEVEKIAPKTAAESYVIQPKKKSKMVNKTVTTPAVPANEVTESKQMPITADEGKTITDETTMTNDKPAKKSFFQKFKRNQKSNEIDDQDAQNANKEEKETKDE